MDNLDQAERIGKMFVKCLKNVINEHQFEEVRSRNWDETVQDTCHSHDFCDANVVMTRAFHICGFCTPADISEPDLEKAKGRATELWNSAWEEAKWIIRESE